MKNLSVATDNDLYLDLDIIDNVYIYKQYTILYEPTSGTFKVSGFHSEFTTGAKVIFPFVTGFDTEYTVTSGPNYGLEIEQTAFTISSLASTTESFANEYVCVKIDITDKLLRNPISNIKQSIEGNDFSDFDSGYIEIMASNEDGYFKNKDKYGLFDSNSVFWLKYYTKFKGYSETWFVFGGLIKLTDCKPNLYDRTIKIIAYGHSYELERYPAFYMMHEGNGILSTIGKFEITNYFESDESEEGIKKVKFQPFTKSELEGIYIQTVSEETKPGVKVLEFRYPYYFRWDYGQWYTITSNPTNGIKEMQAADGSKADVVVGTTNSLAEFPDKDVEMWANVKSLLGDNSERLGEQGKPVVTFDNGFPESIRTKFQRILKLSGGVYTDITSNINYDNEVSDILESKNDSLIIVSPDRFYGIDFLFNAFASTSYYYTIHYSAGGEVFSSNFKTDDSFSDGTNNFTENGKIRWGSEIGNWVVNNIIADSGSTKYTGYMIKITRYDDNASTGLSLKNASRIMRAQGQDGDFIEFDVDKDGVIPKDKTDEIIIRNKSGTWIFGTWYSSVTLEQIMEKFKEVANYSDSDVVIDDLDFSLTEATFNIWGRVPYNGFTKNATCYYIDWQYQYIYVALKLEVWRCKFNGSWEFVFTLDDQDLTDTSAYYHYIKYMIVTGNDLISVIVTNTQKRLGLSSRSYLYQISNGAKNLIYFINKEINDGTFATRYGRKRDGGGSVKNRIIGNQHITAGENMVFPFPQKVESDEWNYKLAFYPRTNLTEGDTDDFPDWYLGNDASDDGEVWQSKMGYYAIVNNALDGSYPDPYEITFDFGFKHSVIFSSSGNIYAFIQITNNQGDTYWRLASINYPASYPVHRPIRNRKGLVPNAVAGTYSGNNPLYFAWMESKDTDDQIINSYISKAISLNTTGDNLIPYKTVRKLNSIGDIIQDLTIPVNAGSYISGALGTNESLVFGSDDKFKTIKIDLVKPGTTIPTLSWLNNFTVYFTGSGDQWIEQSLIDFLELLTPDSDIMNDTYFSVSMPELWAKHSIFGYAIRIKYDGSSGNLDLRTSEIAETVIWDSASETDSERYTVVDMEHDTTNDVIFGCMFNRSNDHNFPFQWLLFAHDIENGTTEYIRTGNNFTFEGSFVYKNFEYDSDNDKMYFTAVNLRHRDLPGFVGYMKWNGGNVTVTKIDVPRDNDYNVIPDLYYNNGTLFGMTAGTDYVLWEYSKTFDPRIELLKFSNTDTLKSVLRYIAVIKNFFYMIHPERKLRFISRESFNGEYYLDYNKHVVKGKPEFNTWKHYYDSVVINWENPYTDNKGEKKKGFDGWNREKFDLNNPLIQNKYIAAVVRDLLYDFLNNYRAYAEKLSANNLPFLELLDRIGLFIPESFGDINNDLRYIIVTIECTSDKQIKIKLLERIGDSPENDQQVVFEGDVEVIE